MTALRGAYLASGVLLLAACAGGGANPPRPGTLGAAGTEGECPDIRVPAGPIAAELAFGYATGEVGFGDSADLSLCLKGLSLQTVRLTAPTGVTVSPSELSSGSESHTVLHLTVRVDAGSGGALSVKLTDSSGHVTTQSPGPQVVTSSTGWRLVH